MTLMVRQINHVYHRQLIQHGSPISHNYRDSHVGIQIVRRAPETRPSITLCSVYYLNWINLKCISSKAATRARVLILMVTCKQPYHLTP